MLVANSAAGIRESLEEIKEFIGAGDLNHAVRRLLDFSRDFAADRDVENEAVSLSARLSKLRTDIRRLGSGEESDRRYSQIVTSVLELADQIYDDYARRTSVPVAVGEPTPRPLTLVPPRVDPNLVPTRDNAPAEPDSDANRSGWEQSREHFIRSKRSLLSDAPGAAFRCRGVAKTYRGSTNFQLSGIDLDLVAGEITGLVGINGSGKTTLLQIVAGVVAPTSGEIEYPSLSTKRHDWARIRNAIAYVQQQPQRWYGRLSDNLHLTAAAHGLKGRRNEDEVEFVLHRLGLESYRDASWTEISGGYKTRFELARALVRQPMLLVLDEPLAPLDIVTQQLFLQDLRDIANSKRRPLPIIVSSQHLYEIETIADQLLFLDEGKPLFRGRLDDVAKDATENLFELTCASSRSVVERALAPLDGFMADLFGQVLVIHVSTSVSGAEVLRMLLNQRIEIHHFRDISRSTRRLFETKGERV